MDLNGLYHYLSEYSKADDEQWLKYLQVWLQSWSESSFSNDFVRNQFHLSLLKLACLRALDNSNLSLVISTYHSQLLKFLIKEYNSTTNSVPVMNVIGLVPYEEDDDEDDLEDHANYSSHEVHLLKYSVASAISSLLLVYFHHNKERLCKRQEYSDLIQFINHDLKLQLLEILWLQHKKLDDHVRVGTHKVKLCLQSFISECFYHNFDTDFKIIYETFETKTEPWTLSQGVLFFKLWKTCHRIISKNFITSLDAHGQFLISMLTKLQASHLHHTYDLQKAILKFILEFLNLAPLDGIQNISCKGALLAIQQKFYFGGCPEHQLTQSLKDENTSSLSPLFRLYFKVFLNTYEDQEFNKLLERIVEAVVGKRKELIESGLLQRSLPSDPSSNVANFIHTLVFIFSESDDDIQDLLMISLKIFEKSFSPFLHPTSLFAAFLQSINFEVSVLFDLFSLSEVHGNPGPLFTYLKWVCQDFQRNFVIGCSAFDHKPDPSSNCIVLGDFENIDSEEEILERLRDPNGVAISETFTDKVVTCLSAISVKLEGHAGLSYSSEMIEMIERLEQFYEDVS